MITTILASGPNWTLRRNGDGPETLELRDTELCMNTVKCTPPGLIIAIQLPPDLAALLTETARYREALEKIARYGMCGGSPIGMRCARMAGDALAPQPETPR